MADFTDVHDFIRKSNKIYRDMYEGDGKENPPMTTRMAILEDKIERMSANLNKLVFVALAGAGVAAWDIIKTLFHLS